MTVFYLLNLNDIQLGLTDLLGPRLSALISTKAGQGQVELLQALKNDIDALPAALTGGRPLADELASADERHDGFGATLYFITEGHLRLPGLSSAMRDAALRIRAAFVPELGELNAAYADEAAKAARREEDLTQLSADLKLFPVAGGKTLHDLATSFVSAGKDIASLLSQRADISATSRKQAQALRAEVIAALNDLRRAIAREAKRSKTLPGDIDAMIFSHLDMLEEKRQEANRKGKAQPSEPTAPPETKGP